MSSIKVLNKKQKLWFCRPLEVFIFIAQKVSTDSKNRNINSFSIRDNDSHDNVNNIIILKGEASIMEKKLSKK